MDAARFYPPEVARHRWEEVPESPELASFMQNFPLTDLSVGGRFDKRLLNVFREMKTGRMLAAPVFPGRPQTRQILLDMIATAAELAPYSQFAGLKRPDNEELFQSQARIYSFQGRWILMHPYMMEAFVNGLGDERYSDSQRTTFMIEDIAAMVHETVHIHNEQDMDFGGPYRVLSETASTTSEYFAFPGRNPKMAEIADNASLLLEGDMEKAGCYNEGLLIGMLVAAEDESCLSKDDDRQAIAKNLQVWRQHIECLPRDMLESRRRALEDRYFLSAQDTKLLPAIARLKHDYPRSLGHLQVMSIKDLSS